MASKSDMRVCVSVGKQISRLFSVKERGNGDLVINMRSAEFYREAGNIMSDEDQKITNQKYSVHCSRNSKEQINAIVHRIKFSNGKEIITSNYTKALKQTNKYAAIYAARAPDLSIEKYSVNPDERKHLSLASFETKMGTLYYMISVCNHESEIVSDGNDYLVKYIPFTHFKLAIIWSFSPIPSHSSGLKSHFMTIPSENLKSDDVQLMKRINEGYSASEIAQVFRDVRYTQHQELHSILKKSMPDIESETLNVLFSLPFTSKARLS
jgi:hypothetical protein